MPIGPGTRLGQYEVQAYVGQGAMGVVYKAFHPQLARTGAVKVLQALSPDDDSTARFRREAQAIAQMRHPNILNVFDFGEYEGTPYMIVEFVDGGSLADRLKQGAVEQSEALAYLRGIATGLDHAHSLGIVHRDVKPANVLLGKNKTPILADFGLAKLMQSTSMKSATGVTTGTPAYMSPEQVTGSQVGPPADNYALATMAYELLTGSIPFEGEGVLELLYAHVHREPPPPTSRKPELGPRVDAVIMKGLAKDPQTRWQSAEDFVAALSAALANEPEPETKKTVAIPPPIAAAAVEAPALVAATAPAGEAAAPGPNATVVAPMAAPAAAAAKPASRHGRRNALLVGLAVFLVAALVLVLVIRGLTPDLRLSSSSVTAGDKIVVTASHLPANQQGSIELFSQVQSFPFKADGQGNVNVEVTVPRNIDPGDHLVKICWSGTCHAQQTLHINAPASESPSPAAITPSPSHVAVTRTIHVTTPVKIGQPVTVTGSNYDAARPVDITIIQNATRHPLNSSPVSVQSNGDFSFTGTVPTGLAPGPAEVIACNYSSGNVPTAADCASQPVVIER